MDETSNFGNIDMRVYEAVAEDQYGNRFPIAVLGVNENAPLIDARAAADSWSLQILPLLDSHVYRIRHSITECGGSHEDFKTVTGFSIETPFMRLSIVTVECPDDASSILETLEQIREWGDERARLWASSAVSFAEVDDILKSVTDTES